MKKILLATFASFLFVGLGIGVGVAHAGAAFSDDFNTGTVVSSSLWHIPTWVSSTDGTFNGQTQMRVSQNSPLPSIAAGNAKITVDTYNPTGASFYGTELIGNSSFSLGTGLDIVVRAKFDAPVKSGTVGGIFLYALKPGSNTLHDEIDFELLGKHPSEVQTNIYANEPLGTGHPTSVLYPSGTIGDYHTYEIKWLPTQVTWLVDGVVVRTTTNNVPVGPMDMHLNMYAPAQGWTYAYDPNFHYTTDPSAKQTFAMSVDSVSVTPIAAPVNHPPVGFLDSISSDHHVGGWSVDPDVASTSINVSVSIDGTPVGTAPTIFSRTDVNTAQSITGNHGYSWLIPSVYWDGKVHTIDVFGIDATTGVGTKLNNPNNKTFTILPSNRPPTGFIDTITLDHHVAGWSVDPDTASTSNSVAVYIDGSLVATTTTTSLRADVNTAQGITGNHGYSWLIPSTYYNGLSHTIAVYGVDSTTGNLTQLTKSPRTFVIEAPNIKIISVPPYGSWGGAQGTVSGVDPSAYSVVTYIQVLGKWWIKPYLAYPLTTINPDGTWSSNIGTGGVDYLATEIRAYLIPRTFDVPLVVNSPTLPASLNPYLYASVLRHE